MTREELRAMIANNTDEENGLDVEALINGYEEPVVEPKVEDVVEDEITEDENEEVIVLDENTDLNTIDIAKLDESSKQLYFAFMNDKKNTLIKSSGLKGAQLDTINNLNKNGVSYDMIQETIKTFKLTKPKTKVVAGSKIRIVNNGGTITEDEKAPEYGTEAFGRSLVSKKRKRNRRK